MLAFHQARLEVISSGRILAVKASRNLRARSSVSCSAATTRGHRSGKSNAAMISTGNTRRIDSMGKTPEKTRLVGVIVASEVGRYNGAVIDFTSVGAP